jgi:hypothetical protein
MISDRIGLAAVVAIPMHERLLVAVERSRPAVPNPASFGQHLPFGDLA